MAIGQKQYKKGEIEGLLDALKRQTNRARRMADDAIQRMSKSAFEPYHEYRTSLTEIEGVVILLEDRMTNAEPRALAQLKDYHTSLITELLRMKIDVILRVFPALESAETLPMGAQKVFLATLWELKETIARMDRDGLGKVLDDMSRKRLTVAETILREVAERAPGLLELAETNAQKEF